jgi:phospholipase/carboxylesterase
MNDMHAGFHVHHEPGSDSSAPPLLLLHGTGGNERDLIAFGRQIAPGSSLLGVRGRLLEGSLTRWFRRHGEGLFDLADMAERAAELASFIASAGQHFGWSRAPIAVGYSNGANIAAGLLMRHPGALSGAVLMRAMNGLSPEPGLDLAGTPVLLLSGRHDPLAPEASRAVLVAALKQAGATVNEQTTASGHGLEAGDAQAAQAWLASLRAA